MRKVRVGAGERAIQHFFAGRSFSSDAVSLKQVHVGAEATDLPEDDCAVACVGAALQGIDKRRTK
jgi:hypothetical protein